MKLNFFDVRSGVDALVVCPVSRAAATQRAGSLLQHSCSEIHLYNIVY